MTFTNRLPTGPGSRGGLWHTPEYRRAYYQAWRLAHPEYREREALRRARKRAQELGMDPADIVAPATFPRPLPRPASTCGCGCACTETIVTICGFCREGMHT